MIIHYKPNKDLNQIIFITDPEKRYVGSYVYMGKDDPYMNPRLDNIILHRRRG